MRNEWIPAGETFQHELGSTRKKIPLFKIIFTKIPFVAIVPTETQYNTYCKCGRRIA